MRMRTYGEHVYSQAQLSTFTEAQTRFDDSWHRQYGVPYGCVPSGGVPVRRARRVTAALSKPLAVVGWAVRVVYVAVAVPLIIIFLASVLGAMFAHWGGL
jgi:hypothetical protein